MSQFGRRFVTLTVLDLHDMHVTIRAPICDIDCAVVFVVVTTAVFVVVVSVIVAAVLFVVVTWCSEVEAMSFQACLVENPRKCQDSKLAWWKNHKIQ